ncbi:MAG: NIPSNAP family protein [Betaproteobacteria bacterium]|nr:NIPSNAP family protein [Betaproteobacteria bacterium]MBL8534490.1 NIPSNAP family protein [Betaproteobacteria bacterium]
MAAFFELREYRIKDGKRDRWVKFMEEKIIPFQIERGMVIVGSWCDPEQPDHYVWMRRFESEEERKALYAAVYEDPKWASDIKPSIDEMLDRSKIVVTRLEPSPKSVIR